MRTASAKDLFHLSVAAVVTAAGWLPSAGAREGVARALGWSAHLLSREKRRRVEESVERMVSDVREQRRVVRASFDDVWRELIEWTAPAEHEDARILGRHHLEQALADGRGAILWESSGFGRRLRAKRILHAAGFPLRQLHGRYHVGGLFGESQTRLHCALRHFFDDLERRVVAEVIYLPASESLAFTRALHERLKRNEILCVAADGGEGQRLVPLPFLGRTRLFASGMVSLAKLAGAPLLPVFSPGTDSVVIEAAVQIDSTAERDRALQQALGQYAALLETYIRRRPDLYRSWDS